MLKSRELLQHIMKYVKEVADAQSDITGLVIYMGLKMVDEDLKKYEELINTDETVHIKLEKTQEEC